MGLKFAGSPKTTKTKHLHSTKISSSTVFWGYFQTFVAKIKICCKNKTSGMKGSTSQHYNKLPFCFIVPSFFVSIIEISSLSFQLDQLSKQLMACHHPSYNIQGRNLTLHMGQGPMEYDTLSVALMVVVQCLDIIIHK